MAVASQYDTQSESGKPNVGFADMFELYRYDFLHAFLSNWGEPADPLVVMWAEALDMDAEALVKTCARWLKLHDDKPTLRQFTNFAYGRDTMRSICEGVAMENGLTANELMRPDRRARIVRPRQEAMRRMRDEGHALSDIGRFFGLDHSTVMHGVKAAEARG